MKKTVIALSLAALALPVLAADKKAEPDFEVTGNFAVVNDYRFRGISQTDKRPAGQGGFDLAHKSGLYVGTWVSNVSQWASTDGAGAEMDFYGGYKGSLPMGVGYDIGYIAYQYPGTTADPKQNTQELYIGLSKGPVSYKLSRTMSDAWFGIADSKGSLYHDLSVSYEATKKLTLSAHAGYQVIEGVIATNSSLSPAVNRGQGKKAQGATSFGDPSFSDFKIAATYDLGKSFTAGLAVTKVNFKESLAGETWFTGTTGRSLYGTGTVVSLTKTF